MPPIIFKKQGRRELRTSVPSWKRNASNSEFLYELYQLNIIIGEVMDNQPQKHKANYCNEIIKAAIFALRSAQTANTVFFTEKTANEHDYYFRKDLLVKAMGAVDSIGTVSEIFLEMIRRTGTVKSDKVYRQQKRIGDACTKCHNLIQGVLKSDKEVYRKAQKADEIE